MTALCCDDEAESEECRSCVLIFSFFLQSIHVVARLLKCNMALTFILRKHGCQDCQIVRLLTSVMSLSLKRRVCTLRLLECWHFDWLLSCGITCTNQWSMCKGSKAQGLQQDKHFKTRTEQKKRTCAILRWNENNNKDDTLPYCPTTAIALQWNGTAEQRRNENNEDDRVDLAIARSLAPSLPSCWVQRSEGCRSSPHWGWGGVHTWCEM